LLTPAENESKGGGFPASWLQTTFPDPAEADAIRAFHHLGQVADDVLDFESFYLQRRNKLAAVIRLRLGVPKPVNDA
jgi:hypothetical protein